PVPGRGAGRGGGRTPLRGLRARLRCPRPLGGHGGAPEAAPGPRLGGGHQASPRRRPRRRADRDRRGGDGPSHRISSALLEIPYPDPPFSRAPARALAGSPLVSVPPP